MRVPQLRSTKTLAMVLVAASLAVGCKSNDDPVLVEPTFQVEGTLDFIRPDGSKFLRIAVELAESREEQVRGLMGRRSLPAKGGMLFVYPEESDQQFWMKNTPLPLDFIFIASDSSIVNIVRRATPLSEERITSAAPAQYVLELRAGFVDRHGIDESIRIEWQRTEVG